MGYFPVTGPADCQLLRRALAEPTRDPGWWERVNAGLGVLHEDFAEHVALTEGPDGCYTRLLEQAPRLACRVDLLLREHAALILAISLLQQRARLSCTANELRGRGAELLGELARHRQRGADLIYQAYGVDLGGEG
ncbi:MAG TPA: hypothetical protein VFX61_10770 [Micromonosporaceae bacterium]|nr:hypothetical protein [Micromonosporaceae bacterium]